MTLKRKLLVPALLAAAIAPTLSTPAHAQAANTGRYSAVADCSGCTPASKPGKTAKFVIDKPLVEVYDKSGNFVRSRELPHAGYVHETITADQIGVVKWAQKGLSYSVKADTVQKQQFAKDQIFEPWELYEAGGSIKARFDLWGEKNGKKGSTYGDVEFTLEQKVEIPDVVINNLTIEENTPAPAKTTVTEEQTSTKKASHDPRPEEILNKGSYRRKLELTGLVGMSSANYSFTNGSNVNLDNYQFNVKQGKIKLAGFGNNWKGHIAYVGSAGRDGGPQPALINAYVPNKINGQSFEAVGLANIPLAKKFGIGMQGQFKTNSISTAHVFPGTTSQQRNNYYGGFVGPLIGKPNQSHIFIGGGVIAQPINEAYGRQSGGYYNGSRLEALPSVAVDGSAIMGRNARVVVDFWGNGSLARTAYTSDNHTLKGSSMDTRLEIAPRIAGPLRGVFQFSYGMNNNLSSDRLDNSLIGKPKHQYVGFAGGIRLDGGYHLTPEQIREDIAYQKNLQSAKRRQQYTPASTQQTAQPAPQPAQQQYVQPVTENHQPAKHKHSHILPWNWFR